MISLIRNRDIRNWKNRGKWVLVYGRRKTGKSFFVRNFTKWDRYFFVGRSGEIFDGDEKITYETFVKLVFEGLRAEKIIVIDEIQRLPEEFYDRLHMIGVVGNLIALSSTLWLAKKLVGENSPLLGLFSEFQVDIIDEADIIRNLSGKVKDPRELIELCVYLREPWLIPLWEKSEDFFGSLSSDVKLTVPALLGEIFSEEDKTLTSVYEGILKAVASGKRVSGEITNHLFSLKSVAAQNPGLAHPYLQSLNRLGILEKIKVWNKERYFYFHKSPVIDLFYYMGEKYGASERDIPDYQAKKILEQKMPFHVEQFFRDFLSKKFGLGKSIISEKDYEIDIALTDFKKLKIVGEVKWKDAITKAEIRRAEDVLGKFDCRKILLVPDKKLLEREPEGIEVWDVSFILNNLV